MDEDEVPDLDAEIGVHVDELACAVAVGSEIDVEFGAWAAGAGLSHHPEVVLHVAVDDVLLRIEAFVLKQSSPEIVGLLVKFEEGSPSEGIYTVA